jgi:hypothetical protein
MSDTFLRNIDMPTMNTSGSMQNTCWALQQRCETPLEKLLLLRIADGCAGAAHAKFNIYELATFACCDPVEAAEALVSLEQWSLLHVIEEGDPYTLAMPWWRPGYRPCAVGGGTGRKLQYKPSVRNSLMELQCARCWYCGTSLVGVDGAIPHVEHQVPLSRGGPDAIANLVMACGPCNLEKASRTVEEYRIFVIAARGLVDDFRFWGQP